MKKIYLLASLFLLLMTTVAFAAMPLSEMRIGGVGAGCSLGYVKSIYGEPAEKEWSASVGFERVTYIYSSTFKVLARKRLKDQRDEDDMIVSGFICTDPYLKMPCGVGVNSQFQEIINKFGQPKSYKDSFYYSVDYPEGYLENVYTTFFVDDKGAISKISQCIIR